MLYVSGMLRHGGKDSLQHKIGKVGGVLTPLISKKLGLMHYFKKEPHSISNCGIYINLSMFIKQNLNIFEK